MLTPTNAIYYYYYYYYYRLYKIRFYKKNSYIM